MIGGMILLGFFLYWLIAKKVVGMVYAETQSITKKRIAIAIFILIPTWDIILGFPIYLYLCKYESGMKIYKTVDNVEGFYVGEQDGSLPVEPYKGYQYIDYKEKKGSKYYRNRWLDSNTSDLCEPVGIYRYSPYAEAVAQGKCIAKQELKESEVSRWEVNDDYWKRRKTVIPLLSFKKDELIQVIDKSTGKRCGEIIDYWWKAGWIAGYFLTGWSVDFNPQGIHCVYNPYKDAELKHDFLFEILKPKQGVSHGNI